MTQENPPATTYETQQERWFKYGANVVLATVIVVILAVLIVYLVEKKPKRFDTTASGMYSLKPQTLNLIKTNKQPITIISLYTKAKKDPTSGDTSDDTAVAPDVDQPGVVADLLEEYRSRGSNIETQVIDPVQSPTKVDDLINQVEEQYGGEIKKYKSFDEAIPARYDGISKLATGELDKIKTLPLSEIQSDEVANSVGLALFSVRDIPKLMKQGQDDHKRLLKQKPPDYKGITDNVSQTMEALSQIIGKVIDGFNHFKNDKAVPTAIRQYMVDSLPKYLEIKKQADDVVAEIKGLGELKLDTLRDALKQRNPILVRGDKEWRVISYDKVWRTDTRDLRSRSDSPIRPRFAGEQMITTAILSLNQPVKPKVCFVRAGGQPLADFNGQLTTVAERLRDYNFTVTDKDLTGMYAMQAMQQQMPTAPEPSDADIEDAIWVVDGIPAQPNPMMGGPPPGIAPKVADHIAHGHHWADGKKVDGGCAMFMFMPRGDDMSAALIGWGITAHTDTMAVHKLITSESGGDTNQVNEAEKNPAIISTKEWGSHQITESMGSLPGILLGCIAVTSKPTDGVISTSLLPVPGEPTAPPSWGETDFQSVETGPKFDKDLDMAPPIFGAVASEKKNGTRVVACGCETMFAGVVDFPDQEIRKRGIIVPAFPGNAEFFMNSIFWLGHQESLIAMSPAAMNVSRINDMSKAALGFWHFGVLVVGLPGLVLLAGAGVYFSRRD